MGHIYQQGLLLLFLLIITSECKVEIETFVTGYQGEDVAFHCFNSDEMQPKNCSRVQWLKIETQPRQPKVILVRPSTPRFQDAERVKWEADKNGKMSFHLTKLQRSDEGLYRCEIWQGWDCIHQTNISLKVKECKIWSVTTAANRPVELKCPVEGTTDQQGLKNVSWVMLKGGNPSPVDFTRAAINETSLVIRSMENRDSGWYRCQYVLKLNQRCFDINLLLQTQRDFSEEDNDATVPTTVGALTTSEIISETQGVEKSGVLTKNVATVTVVIALCAAVIGLFFYCRRNSKAAQQTQMDLDMGSMDGYEGVNRPPSDDSFETDEPYSEIQPRSMCTFNY